eukprot:53414-Eustigmatos_ZCMA.PRE.1
MACSDTAPKPKDVRCSTILVFWLFWTLLDLSSDITARFNDVRGNKGVQEEHQHEYLRETYLFDAEYWGQCLVPGELNKTDIDTDGKDRYKEEYDHVGCVCIFIALME